MFSMCSELTPRAHVPDNRIPQFMQPWWSIICSSPVSLESVDCLLPLLLPDVEVPVERADELHPPLRRTNMIIDHEGYERSCENKANVRSNLHSGNCDHDDHDKHILKKKATCTVARRKAGWTALSHLAASPRRIHLNSTLLVRTWRGGFLW